ncbi:hypothetical protein SLS62_007460 [Diatrype stigma]|uniref:Uncharacterized protein n=1 Tax=Diatrype stigma TaxID=117547 RepID=A0AAN9UN68_9PEZI
MPSTQGLLMAMASLPWLTQARLHSSVPAEESRAAHDSIFPRQEPMISSSTTTSVTTTYWVTVDHPSGIAPTQPVPASPTTATSTSTSVLWSFTRSWGATTPTVPGPAAAASSIGRTQTHMVTVTPPPSTTVTVAGTSTGTSFPWSFTRSWSTLPTTATSTTASSSSSILWSFTRSWSTAPTSTTSTTHGSETILPMNPGPVSPSISSTQTHVVTVTPPPSTTVTSNPFSFTRSWSTIPTVPGPPTPSITSTRKHVVTVTPSPSTTVTVTSKDDTPTPTPWVPPIPDLLHRPELSSDSVCGRWYTKDYSYWIVQLPPAWWKTRYRDSPTDGCYRMQQALWAVWADFLECYAMQAQQASGAPGWLHMRFVTALADPGDFAIEGVINEVRDQKMWKQAPYPNKCRHFQLNGGQGHEDIWEKKRKRSVRGVGSGDWEVRQGRASFAMVDAARRGGGGLIDATTAALARPSRHPATA